MEIAGPTIQDPTGFQFLSVCHYVLKLGIFFYNQKLISPEWHNHSTFILNRYFEYIHNSENETETKLQLLRGILNGTDLYGGGENETLDMKYVNETYQYIISNALFSHYGNIKGYLVQIIYKADNITYLSLKENVLWHLAKKYMGREYCSSRYESISITNLTMQKVFNENIWSLFPEPQGNPEIMDTNYIYAMIGLKIARSVEATAVNLTFDSYIRLAREMELRSFENKNYKLVLELFETPALFYYAYKEKNAILIKYGLIFWNEINLHKVFKTFFNSSAIFVKENEKIESIESLENELKNYRTFKNRTSIATELLKKVCEYSSNNDVLSVYVSIYKTSQWLLKFLLPERCQKIDLPDLEAIFNSQFDYPMTLFNKFYQIYFREAFKNKKVIDKINLNSTVEFANVVQKSTNCSFCVPTEKKINADILIIFAVIMNNQTEFYALKQTSNGSILLLNSKNKEQFARKIANDTTLEMEVQKVAKILKNHDENFNVFIQRLADVTTEKKINKLISVARNPTMIEEKVEFLKSLVPLYTCMESKKSGNQGKILLSCGLDALSLLGRNDKDKYLKITWNSIIAYAVKQISSVFQKLRSQNKNKESESLSNMNNKIYEKDFLIASRKNLTEFIDKYKYNLTLQTLIPGSELSYQVCGSTSRFLRKMIRDAFSNLIKFPEIVDFLFSVKFASSITIGNTRLFPDSTGLIPRVVKYEKKFKVVRYFYPGGLNYFGPKCQVSVKRIAEVRYVSVTQSRAGVVLVESDTGVIYNLYNLGDDTLSPTFLTKSSNDSLVLHDVPVTKNGRPISKY
ncbi:uncharacterized protein LOC122506740 [Leptopilina heterotoma]|uniref:uncharacterized protein LOC122506740 n=1 Tax=Leptopilina heterotoma TaxID=63436 RepID=UPI001CA903A6|nr:uncharacterized protein LOC122506740 [Leptopilina heterotoma]